MPQIVINPLGPPFDFIGDSSGGSGGTAGMLQQVSFSSAAVDSTALQIASDLATIPTITDGKQWATLSITPVSATSNLYIRGSIAISVLNADAGQIAVFAGSGPNALATYYQDIVSDPQILNMPFEFVYTPGSTDPITFSLRYGATNAGVGPLVAINGNATTGTAVQVGDGATFSTFTIAEIATSVAPPFEITITGNDNNPQSGTAFTINGTNGFLFDWNSGDSDFNIIPPNSFVHSINIDALGTGALLAGYTNILTETVGPVTLTLPANADSTIGDMIEIIGLFGTYIIGLSANQQIAIGNTETSIGIAGSVTSVESVRSTLTLRLVSNDGGVYYWIANQAPQGNFTTT